MSNLSVNGDTYVILNLSEVMNGNVQLPPFGAVYLFTKEEDNGNHRVLYVGKTENLVERNIPHHQQLSCVYLHMGNSLCIHIDSNEDSRKSKEDSI